MSNEHHDDGFGHVVPVKLLLIVFVSLVGLTILTVVMNDLPLQGLDIWVAMGIATVKGALVVLFFMHMFWEKSFNILAFFSSLFFVSLFVGMTLMDRGAYRDQTYSFPRDELPAPPQIGVAAPEQADEH